MKPENYLERDLVTPVYSIARRQGLPLVQVTPAAVLPCCPKVWLFTKSHLSCAISFQDTVRGEIKLQTGRMNSHKCWQILEHCL